MNKRTMCLHLILCVILLVIQSGCVSVSKGNVQYAAFAQIKEREFPDNCVNVTSETLIEISEFRVNDVFGNDIERDILKRVGVSTKNTADNSTTQTWKLKDNLENINIEAACAQQAQKDIDHYEKKEYLAIPETCTPIIKTIMDSPTSQQTKKELLANKYKELVKEKLIEKITPHYKITVNAESTSFKHFATSKRTSTVTFDQKDIENPSTAADTTNSLTLFRGKDLDVIGITIQVERKSYLSEQIQKGLDKASESSFFAKTLESAAASYGVGAVGKKIGGAIDEQICNSLEKKYAPKNVLATEYFEFETASANGSPTGKQLTLGKTNLNISGKWATPSDGKTSDTLCSAILIVKNFRPQ
jgi:hypothetical protein